MNKAECKARNLPWPLWECISGTGGFVLHPGEERFDFPCSAIWRDFYSEAPERRREQSPAVHLENQIVSFKQPERRIETPRPGPKPRAKGTEL